MITVAKSFEAPIKLVFPQDILENGSLSLLYLQQFHHRKVGMNINQCPLLVSFFFARPVGGQQLCHVRPRRHRHPWNLYRLATEIRSEQRYEESRSQGMIYEDRHILTFRYMMVVDTR